MESSEHTSENVPQELQPENVSLQKAGSESTADGEVSSPSLTARGAELAARLKPVGIAAEELAARAVDLSARGLTKLSTTLEDRRRRRELGEPAESPSDALPAGEDSRSAGEGTSDSDI